MVEFERDGGVARGHGLEWAGVWHGKVTALLMISETSRDALSYHIKIKRSKKDINES